MAQPPKKTLLTPKRVMEVSDSLNKESIRKTKFAIPQKKIAEAGIKKGEGNKQITLIVETGRGKMPQGIGPTYNERMKIAKDALSSASKDSANAARYKSLALKAVSNKNKKK